MQNVTKTNKQTNKHYKEKDNDIWISAVHFSKFFFNTRDCFIDFVRIDWVQHKNWQIISSCSYFWFKQNAGGIVKVAWSLMELG